MLQRRHLLAAAAAVSLCATTHRSARAGDKLSVVLDWLLDANHAALFAGQQGGFFSRAGLAVDLVAPSDPDSPSRLVAAGQADVAVSYGTQINMLDSAGLPLLRIATLIDRPLNTIMAIGGRGVASLSDLRGKTIGISVGGVEEAMLYAMLQSAGVKPSEVTVVKVNYNMVSALITHRLDAAIGAFRNAEVLQVAEMKLVPVVFLPENAGVPIYDELILAIRRDRRTDPRMARFVIALREATKALLAAPEPMFQSFVAVHPEQATAFGEASWKATMPFIARDPAFLDTNRYVDFQKFALQHGIIGSSLPLEMFAAQIVA
jgi:putative hydroxymethylpyrimidine transport system substrate-binding protein